MSEYELPWLRFPDKEDQPVVTELPYIPPPPEPPAPAWVRADLDALTRTGHGAGFPTKSPEPEEPVPQPPPLPPPPAIDWGDVLDEAWPVIRDQAIDYARDSAKAIVAGKTVDVLHPTVTAADMTGKELIIADAKSRSWRTLVQGLIFDVFAAIVAAVAMLSGADPFAKQTWIAFGVLLLKSVVSAVISYFMRLKITPTLTTEGEKFAIAPVPRPMLEDERKEFA